MKSLNEVFLTGNLGADTETRFTSNGTGMTSFNLAITRNIKKDDKWTEHTIWLPIVIWKEVNLKKGDKVFVKGYLNVRSWEDREGTKRWTTQVVASIVEKIEREEKKNEKSNSDNFGGDVPF